MAGNAQKVHGEKGSVKENVGQDEMNLTQAFIHHPAEHIGEPIIDCSEQREDDPGDNIVEVGHDEIGIVDEDVHGRGRHEDSAQPANDEVRDKSQGKQHRYGETEGTAITIVVIMKAVPRRGFMPLMNIWWPQTIHERKAMAIMENAIA